MIERALAALAGLFALTAFFLIGLTEPGDYTSAVSGMALLIIAAVCAAVATDIFMKNPPKKRRP